MADVFISYSKHRPAPTLDLAKELEAKGATVWWDTELVAGEAFGQSILRELHTARAVIVIWSPPALQSQWVLSEATRALAMKKLVQIRTEDVALRDVPPPFDVLHLPLETDRRSIYAALARHGVLANGSANGSDRQAEDAGLPPEVAAQFVALERGSDEKTHRNLMDVRPAQELAWWDSIKQSTEIESVRDFLQRFPDGELVALARRRLEDLVWAETSRKPDIRGLNAFVEEFPKSQHHAKALEKLKSLTSADEKAEWHRLRGNWWQRLINGGPPRPDISDIERFIAKFPDGAFASQAAAWMNEIRREDLAWKQVQESTDPVVVGQFLKTFPKSSYAVLATGQLARLNRQTMSPTSSAGNGAASGHGKTSLESITAKTPYGTLLVVAIAAAATAAFGQLLFRNDFRAGRISENGISAYIIDPFWILLAAFLSVIIYIWGSRTWRTALAVFPVVFATKMISNAITLAVGNESPEREFAIVLVPGLYGLGLWLSAAINVPYVRSFRMALLAIVVGMIASVPQALNRQNEYLYDATIILRFIGAVLPIAYSLLRAPPNAKAET